MELVCARRYNIPLDCAYSLQFNYTVYKVYFTATLTCLLLFFCFVLFTFFPVLPIAFFFLFFFPDIETAQDIDISGNIASDTMII